MPSNSFVIIQDLLGLDQAEKEDMDSNKSQYF